MGKKGKRVQGGKGKKTKDASPKKSEFKSGKEWKKQKKNLWKDGALEDDLAAVGLRVKYIEPDGNCFFRSLGDQILGDSGKHEEIRYQIVQFIVDNRDMFEVFIAPCLDDDETFEDYISRMRELGSWAGDFEVHAASLLFRVDICIYQQGDDGLQCLCNKNAESKDTIHVSYHDGQHYNSVRNSDDYSDGPPTKITMAEGNSKLSGTKPEQKWTWRNERHIMENTGCMNEGIIHKFLQEHNGAIDLATEAVIQWKLENQPRDDASKEGFDVFENGLGETSLGFVFSSDDEEKEDVTEKPKDKGDYEREVSKSMQRASKENKHVTTRPSNNKPCPCGSGRKYKQCCKVRDKAILRQKQKAEDRVVDEADDTDKKLSISYI